MKTLVVYRSHYGSTRRYAQWLAQALDADAAEERQADARLVQNYECVISVSYTHLTLPTNSRV